MVSLQNFVFWLKALFLELRTPLNYFLSFLVGVSINLLQTGNPFSAWSSFMVPVIVQALSKSLLRYSQRHLQTLLRLPGERTDPAFVMNQQGKILASAGWTNQLFQREKVLTFFDFFPQQITSKLYPGVATLTSPITNRTYRVRIQESSQDYLVWCEDRDSTLLE